MRIPKFEDSDYIKCASCGKEYTYISKKCLHKLCDGCFKKKFEIKGARFSCPFCPKDNPLELSKDDYSKENPLKVHYDCDRERRNKINSLVYKRRENFLSEEEYNNYLEFIENCIQRSTEKDIEKEIKKEIEKKYPQNQEEIDKNKEKRKSDLEKMEEKLKNNDPNSYKNLKFVIDYEGNEISQEILKDNQIKYEPVCAVEGKNKFIEDIEKAKKTGGYDINKIYSFLGIFAKGGFIKQNKNNFL